MCVQSSPYNFKQMNKIKVLLVEDEQTLAMIIKDTLDAQGFEISVAQNGQEGIRMFYELHPDVLVTDVMMPRIDGFELIRQLRQSDRNTPILVLSARSAINDVVEGFEIGANDYLKKPFGMQELIIRIKALVGRAFQYEETAPKTSSWIEIGEYSFNPTTQKLLFAGKEETLSFRESEILKRLCTNKNQVVNTQNILLELWGDDSFFNTRSLQVFITKLRHKLAQDPHVEIVNVRGIGYKLIQE